MPQIGIFKSDGFGYSGQLHTLTSNALLTLEPNRNAGSKGPAFRIFSNIHEVGIAFKKKSGKGNEYLLCLIDDPSFAKPIWANLIISTDQAEIPLMWDRPQPKSNAVAA